MTHKQLIGLAGLGSALLLGGAFVFQALGYAPCTMCIWQRWPHAAAIAIAAVGLFLPVAVIILSGALAALTSAGTGFYHVGVEMGWWEGPTSCSGGDVTTLSADQLFDQIMGAPLIRCDEIAWSLGGISMAGWNVIFSLVLANIWFSALKRL